MKDKSSFTRFFNFFFVSIFSLFLLNSLLLLYFSNRLVTSENSRVYLQKANTISRIFNDSLSTPLMESVFDHFGTLQSSSMMNFLIYENDKQFETQLSKDIVNAIVRHEWLRSIVVYREDGTVVTDFTMRRNLANPQKSVQFEGIVRVLEKKKTVNGWIANLPLEGDGKLLAYYMKYPMTDPGRNRGIVLYVIDASFLENQIISEIDPTVENVVIEDESGQILYTYGNASLPLWLNGTKPDDLTQTMVWKGNQRTWQMVWSPISNQNLSLALTVSMEKMLKRQVYSLRFNLILVVVLAVGLVIYLLSVKNYVQNPISKTLDALRVLVQVKGDKSKKKSFTQDVKQIVDENKSLILFRCVTDLVTTGLARSEFEQICGMVGLRFYKTPFHMIMIEQAYSAADLTDAGAGESGEADFLKLWESSLPKDRAITVRYGSQKLLSVCFVDSDYSVHFGQLFAFAEETDSNIVISPAMDDTLDCSKTYTLLDIALENKIYYGFGNIFPMPSNSNRQLVALPSESLKGLLMGDRYEQFMGTLGVDLRNMEKENIPPVIIRDYFVRLSGTINEVYQRKIGGKDIEELSYLTMRKEVESLSGMQDFLAWTERKIGLLQNTAQQARRNDNKELLGRIQSYISQSIFQNLTEESVAEHFGISAGFLSRLFKEFYADGFSGYLKECKLEAAAQLLREHKYNSINGLAESLGYLSAAYFSRQFKLKFGILPSEYAKQRGSLVTKDA